MSRDWKSRPSRLAPWALVAVLVLLLGIGFVLADDYGSSWDERNNFRAGRDALGTFLSEQRYLSYLHNGGETLIHHGPSYFMAYWLVSQGLEAVVPSWDLAAARHFTNYLTFLLAIGCMYALARRILPSNVAWSVPALFATQPLLFGHAFINQKDMPFLAFFLACVTAGIVFVDWLRAKMQGDAALEPSQGLSEAFREDWRGASRTLKWLLAAMVLVPLLVFLDFFWLGNTLDYLHSVVAKAYAGEAWRPITSAFRLVAEDAFKTSVEEYQFKITWAFWIARMVFMLLLIGAAVWLGSKASPRTARIISVRYRRMIILMILQGFLLGFTISIRPIGAFAGVLVILYWLLRLRWRKLGLWLPYFAAAAVATYLTWPYLWQDPFGGLWRSVGYSGGFGSIPLLFRGIHTTSSEIPWDYFPTLAGIQLTLPILLLFAIGMLSLACGLLTGRRVHSFCLVLIVWMLVPFITLASLHASIYNGIRQLLFLLPPVFLIGGLGLSTVLGRLRSGVLRTGVIVLTLLPGLLAIRTLHPYEYIYFNQLVGGVGGAQGEFDIEYWCTSLRESMEYVNDHAGPGDIVVVWGPYWAAEEFARQDLRVRARSTRQPAFYLSCAGNVDSPAPQGMVEVHRVTRDSAVLGLVFRRVAE